MSVETNVNKCLDNTLFLFIISSIKTLLVINILSNH